MGKVLLNNLAEAVAAKHGIDRRKAKKLLNSFVAVVQEGLDKDRLVKVRGLGTFKVIDVEARESVNVNTGERLVIEGHSRLTFLPDASMKELVNKPFSQFETVVLNDGVSFDDSPLTEVEPELEEETVVDEEEPLAPVTEQEPEATVFEEPMVELGEEELVEVEDPVAVETPAALLETPQSEEKESLSEEEVVLSEEEPSPDEEVPSPEENEPSLAEDVPLLDEKESQRELTESDEEEPVNEEPEKTGHRLMWPIVAFLALFIGGVGGYFLGRSSLGSPVTSISKPAKPKVVDTASAAPTVVEESQPVVEPQPAVEQQQDSASQVEDTEEPIWEKYNKMDARTRDGAYYITGLDRMEKVREGDNSKRIASRVYGGSDMSCYIEVFNGITASTELKPGTEIKIPKIETKKSVRKRIQQQNQ